jgi:hypothetical protein
MTGEERVEPRNEERREEYPANLTEEERMGIDNMEKEENAYNLF